MNRATAVRLWPCKCLEVIDFLFVEFDTSSSVILYLPHVSLVQFVLTLLFARYALSSQSVHSGSTRSEISCKNVDYLHFKIFVMPHCIDHITDDVFISQGFIFVWLCQRVL